MVQRDEYTGRRPKLDIDVLGKRNAGIFTIDTAEEIELPDEESDDADATRKQIVLTFREFPDHAYYLNRGDTVTLIDTLGEDEKKWSGKKLPLIKKPWTYKTKKGVSLRVADLADWPDIGVSVPRAKPVKKSAAKKKARRR